MKINGRLRLLSLAAILTVLIMAIAGCGSASPKNGPEGLDQREPDRPVSLKAAWATVVAEFEAKNQLGPEDFRLHTLHSAPVKNGDSIGWKFWLYVNEGGDWDQIADYDVSVVNGEIGHFRRLETAFQLQAMATGPIDKTVNLDSGAYEKIFFEKGGTELQAFQTGRDKLDLVIDGSGKLKAVSGGIQVFDVIKVSLRERGNNQIYFAVYFDPFTGAYLYRGQSLDGNEQRLP